MAVEKIGFKEVEYIELPPEQHFNVNTIPISPQKKRGKPHLLCKTKTPPTEGFLGVPENKIHLDTICSTTSYIVIASAFMEKMQALGKAGLDSTEEDIDRAIRFIQKATAEKKQVERSMEESSKQSEIWEIAGQIAGGIIDIASITIGATLLASANPLLVLAGIAMIISGLISFSCLILEKTGTKNDITLAFQIAGGIIGFIGGAVFFGTGTGTSKIVLQIALGLITAVTHGSRGASYLYQQDNLRDEARSDRFSGDLTMNRDNLEIASKLLKLRDEQMSRNEELVIEAMKKEEEILRRFAYIQLRRG